MTKLNLRTRNGVVGAVDIGTTKICCFIAQIDENGPRITGIGH